MERKTRRISTFRIISLSFVCAILLGAILLSLPFSVQSGKSVSFFDALFTSTSAACVTGLVVADTYATWSLFGKFVILLLIQVGGLGVITIAVLISLHAGKNISLAQRNTMKEAISAEKIGGILNLVNFIIRFTLITEAVGALLLLPNFAEAFGFLRGLGFAVFHSVSAFCNAGFDLMGIGGAFSSMTGFSKSPSVLITLMSLIIIGGIGFLTWRDISVHGLKFRKYSLQSRVILVATAVLILLPAVYFFYFELDEGPIGGRVLNSVFQSVTTRTAGFNAVDEAALSESGRLITIILMLIGAAPGSTAGGLKVTTVAVLFASLAAVFRSKKHTVLGDRSISNEIVRKASALFLMYTALFVCASVILSRVEGLPLLTTMFESASALGTVGLSLGITPQLSCVSKIVLIVLMYCGRVGGLTLMFAAVSYKSESFVRPKEDIAVG